MGNRKTGKSENFNYNLLSNDYNTLMSAMNVSVSKHLFDDKFTIVWANDFFYEATGFSKEEFKEIFHNEISEYFKNDIEEYIKIQNEINKVLENGHPSYECTCHMPRKEGSYMWIKIVGTFTDEMIDEIPLIYTIFTDITEDIKKNELKEKLEERTAQLMEALQMAEHANQAKSDFLSSMSHDIRTPMNAILGMVSIAEITPEDPVQMAACMGKIKNSAKFLLTLLNDILDMSKIESGKMVLRKKQIDFAGLIRNITYLFLDQAAAKNIDFRVAATGEPADFYIGDELKLNQMLINLLGNAMKFTPENGKIEFIISTGSSTAKSTELLFTIKDNGVGMDKDFLENIFRPFEQEGRQKGAGEGTGLGLAISWNYTHMMNGTIEVESSPGQGSIFTAHVWLDLVQNVPLPVNLKERFAGKRALVADDDREEGEYIISLFKNFGVEADLTLAADEVTDLLKKASGKGRPYNILQIDWRMPKTGQKFIEEIRRDYNPSDLAVGVSAYDWSTIKTDSLSTETDYFLQKPFFSSTVYDFLISLTQDCPVAVKDEEDTSLYMFNKECVLLAEDNDINLEIAVTLLESRNLKVETARDGQEAVELFQCSKAGHFIAVLLDIQMPFMDGLEAARCIRATNKSDAQSVPIIAMSANAFDEDVEKSMLAGMNEHISKPIDMNVLFRTLRKFIS